MIHTFTKHLKTARYDRSLITNSKTDQIRTVKFSYRMAG